MKPKDLSEFCGQSHLIGSDGIISKLLNNNNIISLIFYGPPGTGKTTLAHLISNELKLPTGMFNAAVDKKQTLVSIIDNALLHEKFIIIIDEIHRMNKDKQDVLLPYLETDNIVILGLTTANPYHSINPAIRSRMTILEFKHHTNQDIINRLKQISNNELCNYTITDEIYDLIQKSCNGDMRQAIKQLETLTLIAENNLVDISTFKKLNQKRSLLIDKNGDYYYDLLSAFQKSIRGSDVDASIHYLAMLIKLGDLDIICRRLTVILYEDIGLANPKIQSRVLQALESAKYVGFPEAKHPLSYAVIELALSPKSNTAYEAISSALSKIEVMDEVEVPKNIKHHNEGYKYPHSYGGWVNQQYLPIKLEGVKYVAFKSNPYEQKLKAIYDKIGILKSRDEK